MTTQEQFAEAFEQADAILNLEGMVKPPDYLEVQRAVAEGRLSFDDAVKAIVNQAQTSNGSNPPDAPA
jgi:hypothetical protein